LAAWTFRQRTGTDGEALLLFPSAAVAIPSAQGLPACRRSRRQDAQTRRLNALADTQTDAPPWRPGNADYMLFTAAEGWMLFTAAEGWRSDFASR